MKALLDRYLNKPIGLNYHTVYHIDAARLTLAADTYFGALGEKDGGLFRHKHAWPRVVKVGHVVDVGPMV
jgi:hypothetical protein